MPIHMSGNVRLACRSACQSMCQAYASKYASACLGTSASHYCMSWRMPRNMFVWLVVWNFFYFFHILGLIILTDFNIFRRVFSTTNQLSVCHFACHTAEFHISGGSLQTKKKWLEFGNFPKESLAASLERI